jgi:error-prone DNA polymerase
MGFYSPATLVKDAQRHGVEVRPVDVVFSRVQSDLEPGRRGAGQAGDARATPPPAVRIGLDAVGGASRKTAARIVAERERRAFEDLGDFVRRVGPDQDELEALAELGALASLPGAARERRGTLWQVAALERDPRSLFAGRAIARPAAGRAREDRDDGDAPDGIAPDEIDSPLRPLSALEETLADYRLSGLTTGAHVLAHLRPRLERAGLLPAAKLREMPDGAYVRTAGHAIVRQRPGSAKGFCFVTLEDETGLSNAVLTPDMATRFRVPLHQAALLEVAGPLQRVEGVLHVRVRELRALAAFDGAEEADLPASHDFR